jgi:hypothetical protein
MTFQVGRIAALLRRVLPPIQDPLFRKIPSRLPRRTAALSSIAGSLHGILFLELAKLLK